MLNILQIAKIQDFFNYQIERNCDAIVITPSPAIADTVRKRFDSEGKSFTVNTISAFIKDELNQLVPEQLENYRGKAELNLLLGAIWKKVSEEPNIVDFSKAFNLLTEFRSFSLSEQVLENVLDNYDEKLKEKVLWLHRFLEELNIIDEQKSYVLLSERLRAGDLPVDYTNERNLIFYGFDFFSAAQVDLLKSLALRNEIEIPIYRMVYESCKGIDWPLWFDEHNLKIKVLNDEVISSSTITALNYPKGYLSKMLSQQDMSGSNIILGTQNCTLAEIQELPILAKKNKVAADLFSDTFTEVVKKLKDHLGDSHIDINEVKDLLEEEVKVAIEKQSFLPLKSYLTLIHSINQWEELSDSNNTLAKFDLDIITESASLNLPRINITNMPTESDGLVGTLKNLDECEVDKTVIILSSNYSPIAAGGNKYTENVEKYLASIGPIRNSEFDKNLLKAKLMDYIDSHQVNLFLEEGMLDSDTTWSTLLGHFELDIKPNKLDFNHQNFIFSPLVESQVLTKISASKLQKYRDCPRKYYQDYILKLSPFYQLETELSVLDLGQMQHKVIEKYFEQTDEFKESLLLKLIKEILGQRLELKNIAEHIVNEYLVEIQAYTKTAIQKICDLKRELKLKHYFEYEFNHKKNDISYNGSIDCFLFGADKKRKILLDFKRSNSSFTSYKSILEFEQLQLWFYQQRLRELGEINESDELAIGYIDLSHFENSMLFCNDSEFTKTLKSDFGFKKIHYMENSSEILDDYLILEEEVVEKLKNDKKFSPLPREPKACLYCSIQNICSRGLDGAS